MKLLRKLIPIWPIGIFIFFEVLLVLTNFTPNTYFLGWDNLFPEMNFLANIQRSVFSVWHEFRGVGSLDGMSWGANLVHYVFLYLLHFFMPLSVLRYFFLFLTHFLGGVAIYLLVKELLNNSLYVKSAGLIAGLFYQFNPFTVQMFYAPYEVFAVHYFFLPLLIYQIIRCLKAPTRNNYFIFFTISFLSTPQAHVPTLFIVYMIALFVILGWYLFYTRRRGLRACLVILLLTLCANAFWGIPYAYSAIHSAKSISNSKVNQMATDDIVLKNHAFGDVTSLVTMKGFSLDFVDMGKDGISQYMMKEWREYLKKPIIITLAIILFLLCIGSSVAIFRKRKKTYYPFIILFAFSFVMLGSEIPVVNLLREFMNRYIPYFYQIFRFTFTKFSILYVFSFSVILGYGVNEILLFWKSKKNLDLFIIFSFILFIYFLSLPSFNGSFLYENLKVKIPSEYFQLVDFLKSEDVHNRVMYLPLPDYWGWTFTRWGYRGSGFIWYGVPQTSMDGAMYPWDRYDENYYWEAKHAFNSLDSKQFLAVLEKYGIGWIVFDTSLYGQNFQPIDFEKADLLLYETTRVKRIQSWGSITLYKVQLPIMSQSFVRISNIDKNINPYQWSDSDFAYREYNDYISSIKPQLTTIFYPYRSLFSGRKQEELEFEIEDKGDYFSFYSKIPKELVGSSLFVPPIIKEEVTEIGTDDVLVTSEKYPQIFIDDELIKYDISKQNGNTIPLRYIKEGILEIRVTKIFGLHSFSTDNNPEVYNQPPRSCNEFNKDVFLKDYIQDNGKNLLRLTSINSSNCIQIGIPNLAQRDGYLVSVESRNIDGKSLLFAFINSQYKKVDFETYLPNKKLLNISYFVVPPMLEFGQGYELYFDNVSIGRVKTVNDLGKITIHPIPYRFLTGLKIIKDSVNSQPTTDNSQLISVDHPNPSFYQITTENYQSIENNQTLVLSQSFDEGWKVYQITNDWFLDSWYMKLLIPFFQPEIKNHVLVNNWENGWQLQSTITDKQLTIVIVYLPQYLQCLGYMLLIGGFIYSILGDKDKN